MRIGIALCLLAPWLAWAADQGKAEAGLERLLSVTDLASAGNPTLYQRTSRQIQLAVKLYF